jgi:hypothetical protein
VHWFCKSLVSFSFIVNIYILGSVLTDSRRIYCVLIFASMGNSEKIRNLLHIVSLWNVRNGKCNLCGQ